jgi:hypothetical protein
MVGVAQLAERLVVVQEVAGSTPVAHPTEIGWKAGFHEGRTGYPVRPSLCLGPAGSSGPVEGVQRLTRKN